MPMVSEIDSLTYRERPGLMCGDEVGAHGAVWRIASMSQYPDAPSAARSISATRRRERPFRRRTSNPGALDMSTS